MPFLVDAILLLPVGAVPERARSVLPSRCSDWRLVFNLEDRAYGEVHAAEAGSCGSHYALQL